MCSNRGAELHFSPIPALDSADVADVLATVGGYPRRLLTRCGADDGNDGGLLDPWADEAPVAAGMITATGGACPLRPL